MKNLCLLALVAILAASIPSTFAATSSTCEHLTSPLQILRFTAPLAKLRGFLRPGTLKGKRAEAAIEKMAADDARGFLFKLEGLLRIYDGIYGGELKGLRKEVKKAEDLLGQFTEKKEYLDYAVKVGASKKAIAHMEETLATAKANLLEYLPEMPRLLSRLSKEVKEIDWEAPNADRESAIREIMSELKDYEKLDYDYSDLQGGIHELRRNLRWILIYIQSLDGLILLEKGAGKLNEYSYLETHPIAQSKHSQVPANPRVKNPVLIPMTYFLALSKVVQEIGAVKTSGENVEALAEAYYESGAASSRAHAHELAERLASKQPGYVPDTERAAKLTGKELERTNLLRKLRKWMKSEIEE